MLKRELKNGMSTSTSQMMYKACQKSCPLMKHANFPKNYFKLSRKNYNTNCPIIYMQLFCFDIPNTDELVLLSMWQPQSFNTIENCFNY